MYSLAVAAFEDPPTESNATEMSLAFLREVPLNNKCSRKCVEPNVPGSSSLEPTATEAAIATDGAPGISSLKMRTPLGSTVLQIRDASAVKSLESKRPSFNYYSSPAASSSTTGASDNLPRSSTLVISTKTF